MTRWKSKIPMPHVSWPRKIWKLPVRHRAAAGNFQIFRGQLTCGIGIFDFHRVIYLQAIGWDVDLAAIDPDMTMRDQLASGGAAIGKAKMITNVVQASLENLEHLF